MNPIPCRVCEAGTLTPKRIAKHSIGVRLVGVLLLLPVVYLAFSFMAVSMRPTPLFLTGPALFLIATGQVIADRIVDGRYDVGIALLGFGLVLFVIGALLLLLIGLLCFGTREVLRCDHCGAAIPAFDIVDPTEED